MGQDWGAMGWEDVGGTQMFYIVDENKNKIYITGEGVAIARDALNWIINGPLVTGQNFDDMRIAIRPGRIRAVYIMVAGRGNNGDIIIDINKGTPGTPLTTQQNNTSMSTIFTTQGNRPTLTGLTGSSDQNAVIKATTPDVDTFAEGDLFSIDVDSISPLSRDLAVSLEMEYF